MNTTRIHAHSPEALKADAKMCEALYICPKDENGKRKGPLVAYAGKDENGNNLVGDVYFNFAYIEEKLFIVRHYAETIMAKLSHDGFMDTFSTICGVPNGGRTLGQDIATITSKRWIYLDKKPIPTPEGKKQEYEWDLSRFMIKPGEKIAVVEDVCNNFQNTDSTLEQIENAGGEVVVILCALNRSPFFDRHYTPKKGAAGKKIDIIAALREAWPEYKQGDPEVAEDIAAGNVEFKVKKHWNRLKSISA